MRYEYESLRHGRKKYYAFADWEEALNEAIEDIEFNTALPVRIVDKLYNKEVMNYDEILEEFHCRYESQD